MRRSSQAQLGDRHAFRLGALRALPQALVAGDRDDEVDPSLVRVERQDAARPLAVGQVEVLGVDAERVRSVAAARDRDPLPRAHEHDLIVELPPLGRRTPPALELDGDAGHALRLCQLAETLRARSSERPAPGIAERSCDGAASSAWNAAITSASNCVPALRSSSATASSADTALR